MEPLENHGVQAIVDRLPDRAGRRRWSGAARWSRRRCSSCCEQTNWRDLDYLIVDMPPGTGDIQLTLSQKVPVTGAVIVTTPQDIALLDARKGLKMFEKVGVPILGIVENMAIAHLLELRPRRAHLRRGRRRADVPRTTASTFLGALPLDIRIREQADSGTPTVVARPGRPRSREIYKAIARKVAVKIARAGQRT